ncbi:transcriptional activator (FlhD) [Kosakonia oryzendophytica]|uniref:Transcriptional activator (FlhD) n=1 Tax=Kosakonia oryzendophytica TaxID=1005665 RepID=A0A1C3YSF6_9ENTR|nr:flagellar transcriptional regulator FlhD [Kosakonia oryzendophytica]AMO48239.1 Flagellar transcriptional activator FlhD [Enterobacter sp. FY-07]WBT59889.1 flagellar transcriptional regulator FlhD [Kosakonia oryzendophytica]SCB73027.1 transcriptional activator (FlhD) [Kosakonia oryzendophytica]
MIKHNNLLHDIHQLNLAYLLLVQRLASEPGDVSQLSNGLSHDVIEKVAGLTLPQLVSLAETNQIIVKPSFHSSPLENSGAYEGLKSNQRFI